MREETIASQNNIQRFSPSAQQGLNSLQVEQRRMQGMCNIHTAVPSKSYGRIIRDNLMSLFNLLNLILALLVFLVGSYRNLLFIGVVLCNICIGIIQEIRAKKAVDKLSILSAPTAAVIRNGKTEHLALEEIVLDDIILLKAGNQICSDSVVLEGEMQVNESLLTGESDAVTKRQGDMLLSGSFVVAGSCRAQVEHVGKDNYSARLTDDARKHKKAASQLMDAMNKIIKFVGIAIIPIGLALFCKQFFVLHLPIKEVVVKTVAALIGTIPEGLILLTSIALAVGVIRLARRKTLVQELYCIESLARADVLCLDKTGTLTQGEMQVKQLLPFSGFPEKDIGLALSNLTGALEEDNPTFSAIRKVYPPEGKVWQAQAVSPFSSAVKWSGASFEKKGSFVLGAPEMVLASGCHGILKQAEEYAAQGNRVLLLAYSPHAFGKKPASGQYELPKELCPMALLLLADKIRPQAKKTLEFFRQQGVDLKIISGDNPLTVAEVASRAGLENASRYIDATSLQSDKDIARAAEEYTVFGRVTPLQKRQLIAAMQRQGHTVAMTGDGVNDVLALKQADCSIAMAAGSDAARNISQLVLLDSDFSNMPRVVMEGRRVINNIQRSASLFLVKTIFSFFLAVFFIFFQAAYPFMPIHLTLISSLAIGFPAFVLALEPNKARIQGNLIQNILNNALPGGLCVVCSLIAAMVIGHFCHFTSGQLSSVSVLLTGGICLMVLLRVCMPLDVKRGILVSAMAVAFAVALIFFRDIFLLHCFTPVMLVVSFILLAAAYPLLLCLGRIRKRFSLWYERRHAVQN